MKTFIKWSGILAGLLILLIAAAVLIIPRFIDIKKYKPEIESFLTKNTGRECTIGDDYDLSVFPWAGISFSDLHIKNPQGFISEDFLSVKSFEVRVKLIPLFSKQVEVKQFILDSPKIFLEKRKDGKASWEGLGKSDSKKKVKEKSKQTPSESKGPVVESIMVGKFAVLNGFVSFADQAKNMKKEISDIRLVLENVSLVNPVKLSFKAKIDGKPIEVNGDLGPVGKDPGKGRMDFDIMADFLNQLNMKLAGSVINPAGKAELDISIKIDSFSPRKILSGLNMKLPLTPSDETVLNKLSFEAKISGTPENVSVSNGIFILDESNISFNLVAKEFNRPDIAFDINLDQIDLDRYLPEKRKQDDTEKSSAGKETSKKAKTDYEPLRKLVLNGTIKVGQLKAGKARIQNLDTKITAKNGKIRIDPLSLNFYQGSLNSTVNVDVTNKVPDTQINLTTQNVQAGPLLKDVLEKEFLEGALKSDIRLSMQGDEPSGIKQTLTGKGQLLFTDGAVVGIDLAGMVRNLKSKFRNTEQAKEKPRTDFAEFMLPFTSKNGLVNIDGTRLTSPLLRLGAGGTADLNKEDLNVRVEPKFVGTLKGQGDTKERSGLMVPVIVTGSFNSPKFRPDLKGMIEGGVPKAEDLKTIVNDKEALKEKKESLKKDAKSLFKGLLSE